MTRTGARRLIIDGLAELERAVEETSGTARVPNYLAALLEVLKQAGITLLALKETPKAVASQLDFSTEPMAVIAQNSILLQQVAWREQFRRLLSVLKMSFSAHGTTLREVRITAPAGVEVLDRAESEARVLKELTQQQSAPGVGQLLPRKRHHLPRRRRGQWTLMDEHVSEDASGPPP